MPSTHDYYPVDCPFCNIANAYPAETSPVPRNPDPDLVSPQAHVILSTPHVMAFLDILPMAPGHILLTTRDHYKTVADLYNPETGADWASQRHASKSREDSRAIGEWLPLVSRALQKSTGIEDWNIVQNNGERAAQVVPHVHFHLIPRYQEGRRDTAGRGKVDLEKMKSWRMFGRGTREELDDDEAKEMSAKLRDALRAEIKEEDSIRAKL
jgi:diadenosine tetraphosphate (Ap4A) HIT family hydrolase